MSDAKHTPGPWKVGGEWVDGLCVYHECYPLVWIASARDGTENPENPWIGGNPIGIERARANARLIAAAPELLAACEVALCRIVSDCGECDETRLLRAAIAKAKGAA